MFANYQERNGISMDQMLNCTKSMH
uniref:Uncharacterized protein n=1 Tax=Arundo donax TaxID=35708 RepID=A0A0A9B9V7_ARUDO